MEVIRSVKEMQTWSDNMRKAGRTIGFVPTMGFLHEGHLGLMRLAKTRSDLLVVSIFVNPIQFGPTEDLDRYPRDLQGDLKKLEGVKTDLVFLPQTEEMYPDGFQTEVRVKELSQFLCGRSRPGHFAGVATVVTKLFNITKPHIAVFGQKDFQQLQVIRRMTKDLNMDVEIIGAPIFREPDGLAMSSRNAYLSGEERKSALCLKKALDMADTMIKDGVDDPHLIKSEIKKLILSHPFTRIDYISVSDPQTLKEIDRIKDNVLIALAVWVGNTRLIDNALVSINK